MDDPLRSRNGTDSASQRISPGPLEKFNFLDRLIRSLRLRRIQKYIPSGSTICDIGCGNGAILQALCKKGLIQKGVGLDPFATPARAGPYEIIRADLLEADLPGDCFDVVMMLAVLEHLEEGTVDATMREIWRILGSPGLLIITTPTVLSRPLLEFMAFKLHLISEREIRGHRHYYRRDELSVLARESGFEVIKSGIFQFGFNSYYVLRKDGHDERIREERARITQ